MGIAIIPETSKGNVDYEHLAHVVTEQLAVVAAHWRVKPLTVSTHHHPSWIPFHFVDRIPEAPGALAYHDDGPNGPFAKIGVEETLNAGVSLTSAFDHEALEYLIDPHCGSWEFDVDGRRLMAREVCDPVQDQSYTSDGIELSNCVLPDYFTWNAPQSAVFDLLGTVRDPFEIARGGYAIVMKAGSEGQVFAEHHDLTALAAASRKEKGRSRTFWRKVQAAVALS